MEKWLKKYKKQGKIDFIEVPLDLGRTYHEYLLYSFETKRFSRIFYDNKYREDYFNPNIKHLQEELQEFEKGLNDIGIYNLRQEYEQKLKEINFVEKYAV